MIVFRYPANITSDELDSLYAAIVAANEGPTLLIPDYVSVDYFTTSDEVAFAFWQGVAAEREHGGAA